MGVEQKSRFGAVRTVVDPDRKWSVRRSIRFRLRHNIDVGQCICDRLLQPWLMIVNFVFRCPQTGFNVQHRWPDEEKASVDNVYETVTCPACTRVHLINRSTGKLLGDGD
jgi:hypothetical protein